MSLFIKNIFLVQLCLILAILYPTSLANLMVEVGTRHSHQTLLLCRHMVSLGHKESGLNNSIGPIARNCPKWPSGNHICGPKLPAKLSFWKFGQQTFSCVKQLLIAHPMCSLILRGVLESNSFGFESTFVDCLNDLIFTVFDLIIWSVNYWTLIWIINEICKWDCSISNGYQ